MRSAISILVIIMCHIVLSGQSAEDEVIRLKQKEKSQAEELPVVEENGPSPWNLSVADSADPTKNRWLVNAVSHRAWDPVSGQADYKKSAARIEKL